MNESLNKRALFRNSLWFFLLCLFLLSVAIRAPHINRPLSTNYEWVTAHTLVTLQIWSEEGIVHHRFAPIYTFNNPNDHFIGCPPSGISDDDGNHYYVSYPPFSFILPFLVMKGLGVYPSVLALQIFNLLIHFVCAVGIYCLVVLISNRRISAAPFPPALAAYSVYIFSSSALWHHSNVYFADVLVQLFFIWSVLVLISALKARGGLNLPKGIGIGLCIFFMSYTEWIGVFFTAIVAVLCLFLRRREPDFMKIFWIVLLSSCIAIGLVIWQYLSINGLHDFIELAQNRLSERSGLRGNERGNIYDFASHLYLLQNYGRNYFPHVVILFFGILVLLLYFKDASFKLGLLEGVALILAFGPVAMHHLVFFQFTIIHELALLKACFGVSLLIGICYRKTSVVLQDQPGIIFRSVPIGILVSMLLLSVFFYYSHIIVPTEYFSKRLGEEIRYTASEEETVFFKTTQTLGWAVIKAPNNYWVIAPQIHYYSGRCIETVPSLEAAAEHLSTYNKRKGVVYTINNGGYIIERVERIEIGQTEGY